MKPSKEITLVIAIAIMAVILAEVARHYRQPEPITLQPWGMPK